MSIFGGSFTKSAGRGNLTLFSPSLTRRIDRPPLKSIWPVVKSAGYGKTPFKMEALNRISEPEVAMYAIAREALMKIVALDIFT